MRCDYHRDHGHETNKCRSIKFLVKRLIKAGHLRRYVREIDCGAESGSLADRITALAAVPLESRPAIKYILGGLSDDQYRSKRQKKKLLRAAIVKARVNAIHIGGSREETKPIDGPIFFPPVNPNRVIVPHYDALVLTLCIRDFDVHNVLVDPSSIADLLQLLAFNQMKISLGMLNSAGRILFSFNSITTTTLRDVALPVQAGPVTQQVLFSVVEDLGPYNAIVGRTWLHSMKVVPSTYHQMVSYLTNVGQVDLLSSQMAALQCYQLSIWEQKKEKSLRSPPL